MKQPPKYGPAASTLEQWQALATKHSNGKSLENPSSITPEGILLKPLYTAADCSQLPYTDSMPGLPPCIRGPQATMYAARPWNICQYAVFSTAEASNKFYRQARCI